MWLNLKNFALTQAPLLGKKFIRIYYIIQISVARYSVQKKSPTFSIQTHNLLGHRNYANHEEMKHAVTLGFFKPEKERRSEAIDTVGRN